MLIREMEMKYNTLNKKLNKLKAEEYTQNTTQQEQSNTYYKRVEISQLNFNMVLIRKKLQTQKHNRRSFTNGLAYLMNSFIKFTPRLDSIHFHTFIMKSVIAELVTFVYAGFSR
jgi:predicted SprT family Zn-dependent metalloprotease